MESRTSIEPQTLAKIQGLRLRARHIVEGYVAGLHPSPYQGFSIEFAEHREYAPGDDLRYLDWKVFGKLDRKPVKRTAMHARDVPFDDQSGTQLQALQSSQRLRI